MVALILAAGYGTRLYPLTKETPKALLPVRGRPILEYLIDKITVASLGVREMVLVSNSKYAPAFERWADTMVLPFPHSVLDDASTCEEDRLGSVGDLVYAMRARKIDEDLLVLGSDNLFPDPLTGFLRCAREKSSAVTLGIYELPDLALASRYGVLEVDREGRIIDFKEKPQQPTSKLISAAVYFFPQQTLAWVLEYLDLQPDCDTLGKFIHWLVRRERVYAYRLQGPWFDVGDETSYNNAKEHFIP